MNLLISLSVDEVNFIINTIAEKPYNQVADLLQNIRHQALEQVSNNEPEPTPYEPALGNDEPDELYPVEPSAVAPYPEEDVSE